MHVAPPAGTALLVEDEDAIAALVRSYLERDGFTVVRAARGDEALVELERRPVRVVVLDVGLPDMDGFDVCRAIRARSRVPVLMLTARDEEPDRITGLEMGADDYVTKPFSPRELLARVRAVLRRAEAWAEAPLLTLGDVSVRREARVATVAGDPVELTGKEFDLLAFFLGNADAVLSRELLLDRVWGLAFPGGTRTVDVHVASLRRKLGRPALIRTVRGIGYRAVRA
ncbi:MAG TPA: response regulator transcription factor [Gaiellaceae bacterium]|nr:response regulator transcription factor [Gaiellaceae bacterium]